MRILMFGRGVIATIYGQALHDAGHDVEFYVRPGRAAEYGPEVHTDVIDARRTARDQRVRGAFPIRLG
jgi:2-dehydropantoate 2-reductase